MTAPTVRNFSPTAGSSFQTPMSLPQPLLGDVIVAWVFAFNAVSTGVTDSAGNTYTAQAQQPDANGNYVNLFTAPVTATGSGTLTVTSANGGGFVLMDITGAASGSFIDGLVTSGQYSGSVGGLVTASAITTSFATDLIISAAFNQNGSVMTANTGTLVTNGTLGSDFCIVQTHTTSTSGSYAESITVPVSVSETAVIVAIAIQGVGGGGGNTASIAWVG